MIYYIVSMSTALHVMYFMISVMLDEAINVLKIHKEYEDCPHVTLSSGHVLFRCRQQLTTVNPYLQTFCLQVFALHEGKLMSLNL